MPVSKAQQGELNAAARLGPKVLIAAAEKVAPSNVVGLLAEQIVSLRRTDVAVIGDQEAFIRRTDDGSLKQVIRPVKLTVAKGDLFQIPKNVPVDVRTGEVVAQLKGHRGDVRWEKRPIDPKKATLTVQGMQAINQVAGVAVATPPTVLVDGVMRSNPYVERAASRNGRPGDMIRIVLSCVVIGSVPATGNPVAVNYTLEYSPERELLAMAANLLARQKDNENYIGLTTDVAFDAAARPGWQFIPLYGGLGYAVNVKSKSVEAMYGDFANILTNALKKAQTVCMRNAMRRHPALGAYQSVAVNDAGEASVPVIGWAGSGDTLRRYQSLAGHISAGANIGDLQRAGLLISVNEIEESFDPSAEVTRELETIDAEPGDGAAAPTAAVDRRDLLVAKLYALAGEHPEIVTVLGIDADSAALGDLGELERTVDSLREAIVEADSRQPAAFDGDDNIDPDDDADYGGRDLEGK